MSMQASLAAWFRRSGWAIGLIALLQFALHAAELAFEHPVTGERMRFEMPLPDDLREWLARLRREAR